LAAFQWQSLPAALFAIGVFAFAGCGDQASSHDWAVAGAAGPNGKKLCSGDWVDLKVNPSHCGACGLQCQTDEVCSNGKCALFCEEPLVDCGGVCANLQSDTAHCGSCSGACRNDQQCISGSCKLNCTDDYVGCGDRCVDLKADPKACGKCGTTCATGQVCKDGECKLPCIGGTDDCDGKCVDLFSDKTNCGGCGTTCKPGWVCSKGQCAVQCTLGMTPCGGGCADMQADEKNCGKCGKTCPNGQVCSAGKCALSCADTLTACDGGCHDVKQSVFHCGGCGKACSVGESCVDGACKVDCKVGLSGCDGACVDPKKDANHCGGCGKACAPGKLCVDGACTVSCTKDKTACGGGCVDIKADAKHCGGCGKSCPAGQSCVAGACKLACSASQTPCGGACVDLKTDESSCGKCGTKCKAGHVCVDGACSPACPDKATNCGGTCADLDKDAQHCGKCGVACGLGESCQLGACKPTCKWPLFPCGGICVDMAHHPAHCGGCGKSCVLDKGTAACVGGVCQVVSCAKGFANCDGNAANGCESELLKSGANCGACGKTCNLHKAIPSCVAGKCVVTKCEPGYGDCNGDPKDGCEVHLGTSSAHCGKCGSAVKSTQLCCGGKPIAASSFAKDVNNCGGCGNACKAGQTCCGGFCYTPSATKICPECGKICNVRIVNGNKFITTGAVSRLEASGAGISTVSNLGGKNKVKTPRIWIAAHDSNLVNRLDTGSGKLMSVFPSFGSNPSRGAVALDDTFWIGNRCPNDPNNSACSNVAQLNNDGTQGCLVGKAADGKPLPFVRAIAVDEEGFIWIGTWNDNRVHKIDPLACKAIKSYGLPSGANPYGFAIDNKGLLWISSPTGAGNPLRSFDTKSGKIKDSVKRPYNTYGVVMDGDNNVWYAGWCTNHLMMINGKTKKLKDITFPGFNDQWSARGMAVDSDGNIWAGVGHFCKGNACSHPGYVLKYQKGTGKHLGTWKIGKGFGGGALGVSMDANGRIWATSVCSSKVARISKDTGATELVANLYGKNPYTYSDWAGAMLKNVTTNNGQMGVWTANFDGTAASSRWQWVSYDKKTPKGTRVRLRFRASSAIEAIEGAPWCVPPEASPIDLKKCNFGKKRYLQVQVYLITRDVDVRPSVDNFKVYWQN